VHKNFLNIFIIVLKFKKIWGAARIIVPQSDILFLASQGSIYTLPPASKVTYSSIYTSYTHLADSSIPSRGVEGW